MRREHRSPDISLSFRVVNGTSIEYLVRTIRGALVDGVLGSSSILVSNLQMNSTEMYHKLACYDFRSARFFPGNFHLLAPKPKNLVDTVPLRVIKIFNEQMNYANFDLV